MFYRIIRAGIGVFCLLGLRKLMFVSNVSETTTPSLPLTLKKTQKSRHYVRLQKTVPGRVRTKFAQNGGHEKATKKNTKK